MMALFSSGQELFECFQCGLLKKCVAACGFRGPHKTFGPDNMGHLFEGLATKVGVEEADQRTFEAALGQRYGEGVQFDIECARTISLMSIENLCSQRCA